MALAPFVMYLPFVAWMTVMLVADGASPVLWVHAAALVLAIVLAVVATIQATTPWLGLVSLAGMLLAASGICTLFLWPKGEDGAGIGWLAFITVPSAVLGALSTVAAWSLLGIARVLERRGRKDSNSCTVA